MPPDAADTIIQAPPTQLLAAPAATTPAPAACRHGFRCFALGAATVLFIVIELGVLAAEFRVLGFWH